jgi:broad specificity phosphatase PhoE
VTRLVLVRHGESIWHAENRYAGRTDIPLSARGREQAQWLASWTSSAQLSAIWVSPLLRARETAAPAERATGLIGRVDSRLREIDFGQGEGLTDIEIGRAFPEALAAFLSDPAAHPLPGGEDLYHGAQRAIACFKEIETTNLGGRVLVITHSTLLRLALCQLIGVPLSAYRTVYPLIINGAITEVSLHRDNASLLQFNVPLRFIQGGSPTHFCENEP